jgi:hypothetical protein
MPQGSAEEDMAINSQIRIAMQERVKELLKTV